MRRFTLAFLLTLATSGRAYNCTGKPTTYGEAMAHWATLDVSTRPGIAVRPLEGDSAPNEAAPDDVYVSLQINRLADVDTKVQTFTVEVWLRTIWQDGRLAYDNECLPMDSMGAIGLPTKYVSQVWTPDLYSPSEAQVPKVLNSAMWVYPNGKVWWLRKMLWTLNCGMDFTNMPHDVFNCTFAVSGFSQSSSDISLKFPDGTQPEPIILSGPIQPVCTSGAGGSVEFAMTSLEATRMVDASQSVVPETQLVYHIQLTRHPEYYMTYVVTPTVKVVFITWLSFWVSRAAVRIMPAVPPHLTPLLCLLLRSRVS